MKTPEYDEVPDGYVEKFSAYITLRNGKRLYAWQKGKKAFRFLVPLNKA